MTPSGLHHDERGFVIGFFVKLAIFLVFLGLVVVEGGAGLWARFQVKDAADSAAVTAADTLKRSGSADAAMAAVEEFIDKRDQTIRLTSFEILQDGTVRLVLRKKANTILVQHIGFLKGWQIARATGEASPPRI